jgi:hypothetical protein
MQNFQTNLDGKTTKTKVVNLEQWYNFVVDQFPKRLF